MQILFDVTALMRHTLTGIGVYVSNLAGQLESRQDLEFRPVWRADRFRRRSLIARHLRMPSRPYIPCITDRRNRGDLLFHGTDFRIPTHNRLRTVVTIHDVVVLEPGLVDKRFAEQGRMKLERTLRNCKPDRIIVTSRFTYNRLVARYPDLADRIDIVPLGVDRSWFFPSAAPDAERAVQPPYLLSVGSVEYRKNLLRTIEAFEQVHHRHPDLHLVIAGGNGHRAEDVHRRIADSPQRDAIATLGVVTDPRLVDLYRNATMLLYPSLYEGFGIPILEAMASGCPVVTSNIGAPAEVAGDAAELVDAERSDAIAHGILQLLGDDGLCAERRRDGLIRAAEFTWERCARGTVECYNKAMQSADPTPA